MQLSRYGEDRVPYSDILRTVGLYIDGVDLSAIRILETDEGLILQGVVMRGARAGERDTYQLSNEDIKILVEDAHAKRGKRN
jgi:hypothetical protein